MAQLMPLPLTVSCFSKIQTGFTFWYRLTWVVPEKGSLNGCVCVCVCPATVMSVLLLLGNSDSEAGCLKTVINVVINLRPGSGMLMLHNSCREVCINHFH